MTGHATTSDYPSTAVLGHALRSPGGGSEWAGSATARAAAILALALAYFVGGRLGLLLAVPPGFASAVWPASGIALGALVVFGARLWPGVLLGSFCVNAWMSFDTSDAGSIVVSMLVCGVIALGSTLQALVGSRVVRRAAGSSPVFDEARTVVFAMLLGGPLACLVSASVGVGTLFAMGAVPAQNVAFNWWNWWVGDSIGVLIFMPLVLVAFGRPRAAWRPRVVTVALPLAAVFGMVVVFFTIARRAEDSAVRQEFHERASAIADSVSEEVSNTLWLLHGVERFFAASIEVDRQEFRVFVVTALTRRPGLTALSWNPVVPEDERAAFVSSVRAEGFAEFEITQLDAAGQRMPAAPGAVHVVVTFIEPLAENMAAMGWDVASEPERCAALELARDTGRPAGTGTLRLVQGGEDPAGMLVFMPVYRNGTSHETVDARRSSIQGYLVGVLRFDDLLGAALRPYDRTGIQLHIHDLAAPVGGPPLYAERGGVRVIDGVGPRTPVPADGLRLTIEKDIAGRRWALSLAPMQGFFAAHRSIEAWLLLAGGMSLAGLLGVFLLILTGRTMRIAAMVDERTADLSRVNAALGESQRRFELAVEGSSVGIWEWTIATGEDYFSPRWKALLGYADDELPNVVASWSDRLHPDDAAGPRAAATGHLERREVYDVEYRLRCKDGAYRWFHARGQAVWDADGKPVKMAGSLVDVHARKQAEARLVESETRFRALADSAPMLIWTSGTDAKCDYFNKPWLEFTGRRIEEELGDGWAQGVHADDLDRCFSTYMDAFTARRPFEMAYRLRRHDGAYRTIMDRGVPRLSPNGDFDGYVGACMDISELRDAQSAAESASRAKGAFLANMSHEIRTPLTAILGFADVLREDGNVALAPEQRLQSIDTIRSAGAHLHAVINDILDLSKIEADKMTVECIDTPLVAVLREVESLVKSRAASKGLTLGTRLITPVPDRIVSDPTRLRQILMNLVGNAIKFTQAGGVTIDARVAELDGVSRLVIDVEDTGPGMTTEQAGQLFQAFGQADSSVTRKHGGTGLGLVISRRLAGLMGGDVALVRTEPGKGSCFRLTLPLEAVAGSVMVERIDAVSDDKPAGPPPRRRSSEAQRSNPSGRGWHRQPAADRLSPEDFRGQGGDRRKRTHRARDARERRRGRNTL